MMNRRTCAAAIFLVALAVRVLFWQATPDRQWGWSVHLKGDAPVWLAYGRAIDGGQPFELGLPIRPPGAAWLVALVWDGSAARLPWVRLAWIVMGALVPLLVVLVVERSFGLRVAMWAGTFCAMANGLLILSTSIDNETPYLVLAMLALWTMPREKPSAWSVAAWGLVNAAACLVRAEHVIFFVLGLIWSRRRSAVALAAFAAALIPWHLAAWESIHRFNEVPRVLSPAEERAIAGVEQRLGAMWTPEGRRRCEELPAFTRRTLCAFVLATVHHRGGDRVQAGDFRILDEAFDYVPRPLARFPFVSNSGPLNFYLANNPRATGGFDRAPLEEPPPLRGSYPDYLVQNLPPPRLTFFYPPHLRLFNEGYALGLRWMVAHPGAAARLTIEKLRIFWSGASLGLTGWNIPMGAGGIRRPVDLVVPQSAPVWRLLLLAVAMGGVAVAWRRRDLHPWLLYLVSRIAAAVLFFGYARHGATAIPVVALLAAIVLERLLPRLSLRIALAVLLIGVALEAGRVATRPVVTIDGQVIGTADPDPPDLHEINFIAAR